MTKRKATPTVNIDVRSAALSYALEYHRPPRAHATPEEIIATAQKFSGFLLVQKQSMQPRA